MFVNRIVFKTPFQNIFQVLKGFISKSSGNGFKSVKVAIIGRPNVGKSTLLNKLIGYQISGVSNKVHTTRVNILGVISEDNVQIEFIDSPGIVGREHAKKHRLDYTICGHPKHASSEADVLAVVVDASCLLNSKLDKHMIQILAENADKRSILILNKIDKVKKKPILLDISTRLTRGIVDGKRSIKNIDDLSDEQRRKLNLIDKDQRKEKRPIHKYVTCLDTQLEEDEWIVRPNSWDRFSRIFQISALEADGVDSIKAYLKEVAYDVDSWSHTDNFITDATRKQIVSEIIRGKIMDYTSKATPYLFAMKFLEYEFSEELGMMKVYINISCDHQYHLKSIIGENGTNIRRMIREARQAIQDTFGCEVSIKFTTSVKKAQASCNQ